MLTLCGFGASNYYNKVKLALLEKGVPFDEKLVWPDRSPELLEKSLLGKLPYFEVDGQTLVESQPMLEYLEARYPQRPLLPADPFRAAKVRELLQFIELHLELVARELYAEAWFGGKASEETKARVRKLLKRHSAAFGRLAKFAPYVGGPEFTVADCGAAFHLPNVVQATKQVLGEDMLADYPVGEYLQKLAERPTVQRVNAERKANSEQFLRRFARG